MVISFLAYLAVVSFWITIDLIYRPNYIGPVHLLLKVMLYFSFVPLVFLIIFRDSLQPLGFDYIVLFDDAAVQNYLAANSMYAFWGLCLYLTVNSGFFKISDNSFYNRKFSENAVLFVLLACISFLIFSGALAHVINMIIKNPLLYLLRREALDDLSPIIRTLVNLFVVVIIPVLTIYLVVFTRKSVIFALFSIPFTLFTFQKAPIFSVLAAVAIRIMFSFRKNANKLIIAIFALVFFSALYAVITFEESRGGLNFFTQFFLAPIKIFARLGFSHHVANLSFFSYHGIIGDMGVSSDRLLSLLAGETYRPISDLVFRVSDAVYGYGWSNNAGLVGSSYLMGGYLLLAFNLTIFAFCFFGLMLGIKLINSKIIERLMLVYLLYLTPAMVGTNMSTILFFYKLGYIAVVVLFFGLVTHLSRRFIPYA